MKRLDFIDQLKALSIFLVVYGHTDEISGFNEYLSTFRMPLFFAISGYVSKDKQGIDFTGFFKKSFNRLLIPYFVFSFLLFSIWFVRVWLINFDCGYCNPLKNFFGIFYSQGGPAFMTGRGPMWFLTALFCVALIDYCISQFGFKIKLVIALVLPFLGLILTHVLRYSWPWSFDVAMVAYFFYFGGMVLKRIDFFSLIKGKELLITIILFSLHLFLYRYNKPVEFVYKHYGFMPLMLLNGLVGLIWVFSFFKIVPVSSMVTWIGRNTLLILIFHLLAKELVFLLLDSVFMVQYNDTVIVFLLISILQVIVLVPLIHFLNKYFPFLVGLPAKVKQVTSI